MTPIAAFAPMDKPESAGVEVFCAACEVLEEGGREVSEVDSEVVVVAMSLVWVVELDEDVEAMRSVLSCTIRTPNALIPCGDVNPTRLLDVLLSSESVTKTDDVFAGFQVQNSVDQSPLTSVDAQERVIPPSIGQQVTVVMLFTPSVS